MTCSYCGHGESEHAGGTDDFPTGCMHFGSAGADYGDAENCDGHCLCPEYAAPALDDQHEAPESGA